MFGLLQIALKDAQDKADYAYVIGLRGAIDKSLARSLAVGNSVFVCDNLAFSSEIVFSRKSTKNILLDLPSMVDTAIGQLGQKWNDQDIRIELYKKTPLTDKDAAYMLIEMAKDVFPIQRLGEIYQEFKTPRHTEFEKQTLWALFNAVTEYLKPRNDTAKASGLWTMPSRTARLYKFCDDVAGLMVNTQQVEVLQVTAG